MDATKLGGLALLLALGVTAPACVDSTTQAKSTRADDSHRMDAPQAAAQPANPGAAPRNMPGFGRGSAGPHGR
jgi:hypothetical protein